jgi:hypothetical protein
MEDSEQGQLEAGRQDLSIEEGSLDDTGLSSSSTQPLRDPSRFYNLQVFIEHSDTN